MTKGMTMAVVIPTYKRPLQLRALLDSLEQQVRKPDEVIVACRGSDSPTIEVVRQWQATSPIGSRCKIADVREPGHMPPLAAALDVCESEVFCQIDDDAIPFRNWLYKLERDFLLPDTGGICGKVINHPTGTDDNGYANKRVLTPSKLSWFGRSGSPGRLANSDLGLYEADCFHGGNMAFRTRLLAGCIDLKLNGGSSVCYETDVALSVARKGYKLYYDPEAVIDHYPAPRGIEVKRGINAQECYRYAHNLTFICLKHLSLPGKIAFILYFFLCGQWECPAIATYALGFFGKKRFSLTEHLIPSFRGRAAGIGSYIEWRSKKRNHQSQSLGTSLANSGGR